MIPLCLMDQTIRWLPAAPVDPGFLEVPENLGYQQCQETRVCQIVRSGLQGQPDPVILGYLLLQKDQQDLVHHWFPDFHSHRSLQPGLEVLDCQRALESPDFPDYQKILVLHFVLEIRVSLRFQNFQLVPTVQCLQGRQRIQLIPDHPEFRQVPVSQSSPGFQDFQDCQQNPYCRLILTGR